MRRYIGILVMLVMGLTMWGKGRVVNNQRATSGMTNPYTDEKLVRFGFSLSVNFMALNVHDSNLPINGETYHARVSGLTPGFSVGFVSDLRLCKYLNLRFTPALNFSSRTISYKTESGNPVHGTADNGSKISMLSMPIDIPLYLKWSSQREANYRPYVIAGGGVAYNVSRDRNKPVLLKPFDYFVSVGFGCDFYLSWFKLCPELRYQIGFANLLTPADERPEVVQQDKFYTNALSRLSNQMLTLTFNFE